MITHRHILFNISRLVSIFFDNSQQQSISLAISWYFVQHHLRLLDLQNTHNRNIPKVCHEGKYFESAEPYLNFRFICNKVLKSLRYKISLSYFRSMQIQITFYCILYILSLYSIIICLVYENWFVVNTSQDLTIPHLTEHSRLDMWLLWWRQSSVWVIGFYCKKMMILASTWRKCVTVLCYDNRDENLYNSRKWMIWIYLKHNKMHEKCGLSLKICHIKYFIYVIGHQVGAGIWGMPYVAWCYVCSWQICIFFK